MEPDDFGIATPYDEWALEHTGMTAREMIRKYPTLFPEEFAQLERGSQGGQNEHTIR